MTQPTPARFCPKCARKVDRDWRLCPACGTPLDAETETVFSQAPSSSSSVEEGRFPAGTVLAGRYRVLGLIGQGGMGEVYRAYDLILNQAVALKFLAGAQITEAALVRFRNEVRIARQVSHPNVCRVYDIGFIEGLHFLSMEYLDGEDLGSLLRRIGRLPQDKAIEFTRKICAGLAAAHERGVLHRDLKPSNIMIDGRGQVRITDFGLAALAVEIPLSDLRSGTPAYMAPEQKAGKEVTTRSDLYSLGLVLHEMFTGKRRSETTPTELVKDLDPAIERIILRCLEVDPKRRPSSALSVALALPGGDPIAVALAAGETPSPEMVAASGEKEGFSPRTAAMCVLAILLSVVIGAGLAPMTTLLGHAPLEIPPDALAYRAQEILKQLGYSERPRRVAYQFQCCNPDYPKFLDRYDPARRDAILASHRPPVAFFWYRQSQGELRTDSGNISFDSPENTAPGMVRVVLDAKGRLIGLEARPSAEAKGAAQAADGAALLTLAALDPARFAPVAPATLPSMPFDARFAWTGTYAEDLPEPVRVEAAFWQGRPVFFQVGGSFRGSEDSPARSLAGFIGVMFAFIAIVTGSVLAAWRNWRLGRGDRAGAAVMAVAAFALVLSVWVLSTQHVAGASEFAAVQQALGGATLIAITLWLSYIAIEPYVRRNWPDCLISWTRLCSGRIRNPLVASHILAGLVLVEVFDMAVIPGVQVLFRTPPDSSLLRVGIGSVTSGIAAMLSEMLPALAASLAYLLLIVFLRLLLRRLWIADIVGAILLSVVALGTFGRSPWQVALTMLVFAVNNYLLLWLLRRFGFLAMIAWGAVAIPLRDAPILLGTWYGGRSLAFQFAPVVVAAWALWVIVSSQRRPATESAG